MPSPALPGRRRRTFVAAGALVALTVLLLSPTFGRAEPNHNYRPDLPPDALSTGCYPLPGDASFDFPYQVRWDADVDQRRELRGQYDVIDRDEAEASIVAAFEAVGFERAADPDADGRVVLTGPDEVVRVSVTEIPGTSADTLVRGEFVLDLPVVERSSDDPICDHHPSTKRWDEVDG